VFRTQLAREKKSTQNIVFMDRSKIDGVAYFRFAGLKPPAWMTRRIKSETPYDIVFFLDFPTYKQEDERPENEAQARHLADLTFRTYQDFGYEPVRVPPRKEPCERAAHLLKLALATKTKKLSIE